MSAGELQREREAPSPWIVRFAALIPAGSLVLDLACGTGRHTRLLCAQGQRVLAVDRDADALRQLYGVDGATTLQADLEQGTWPLAGRRFDAVVVTRYLHRPRIDELLTSVAADGALLYETFAQGNEAFGKPSNRDFLLAPDELLDRVRACMRVVAFEQGLVAAHAGGPAVLQRIAAVGLERAWPSALP